MTTPIVSSSCPKTEKFILRSAEKHNNKYDYSKVQFINNRTKVCIICLVHGEFWQMPGDHLLGKGCRECGFASLAKTKSLAFIDFERRSNEVHKGKYTYHEESYTKSNANTLITCPDHGDFWQWAAHHLKGHGCPECGNMRTGEYQAITFEEFESRANETHDGLYQYDRDSFISMHEYTLIFCNLHREWFRQTPSSHLRGRGCPLCKGSNISKALADSFEEFEEKAVKIHGRELVFHRETFTKTSGRISVTCTVCGITWDTSGQSILIGGGCPRCASSKGEKLTGKILNRLGIKYEIEKRFDTCKHKLPLPFDFYIDSLKCAIEFHGIQHYEPLDIFGGEEALQGTQHRDDIKRQWCKQNGITLIEVKYDIEDVRSHLIREINKVARKFNRVYGVVNVVVRKKVTTQASPG